MTRAFLAVGLLLGVGVSVAHAEYLRIIYNLSSVGNSGTNTLEATPGVPTLPGERRPGVRQPPGTQPGLPNQPPSTRRPPTAPPGVRPMPPGVPSVPPGAEGRRPPRTPAMPINPGLPEWMQNFFGQNAEEEEPIQAEVVVEYDKADRTGYRNENRVPMYYPRIYHRWGQTALIPNLPDLRVEFVKENGLNLPPVAKRFKHFRDETLKEGTNAETLLKVAEWALNHALLDQFGKAMEELKAVDSQNPSVKAFDYYQEALKKRLTRDDEAYAWKAKINDNLKEKRTEHYNLLYSVKTSDDDVTEYVNRLEQNYRSFFYWFALKGKQLPIPQGRQVVVLFDDAKTLKSYQDSFDIGPLVADGFYTRRENIAMASAKRMDEVFDLLVQSTKPLWETGWDQDQLLKGAGKRGSQPDEIVRNQMLALLLRAMQDESALATVSHDGSRQLAVATGLLPRNVEVPEWIDFGMGSFFETPKGAFWPGVGAPSWKYLVKFKLWKTEKKLDSPAQAIRSVITDKYFRDIHDRSKQTPLLKARTMAWGLTFFLMNRKTNEMMRYFEELNRLPRDMDFDDQTLIMTFARAFGMVSKTPSSEVLDSGKLDKLADEWFSYLDLTPIESSEALQDAIKQAQKTKKNTPAPTTPTTKQPKLPQIKLPIRPRRPGG